MSTVEAQTVIDTESVRAAEQSEAASADVIQTNPGDEDVALESCDTQTNGDAQSQANGETTTQAPDDGSEQTDRAIQTPENEMWVAGSSDASAITCGYVHDPRENPQAMADIIEDATAVYGFRPSTEGSLAPYADLDWTDPEVVERGRRERIAYHESIEEMYTMLYEMQAAGATTEQIARAVSAKRNEIRIASYANDPEGLERLKARNLEVYGNENGGTPEYFYELYGSWEMVIDKSFSTNSGMDACLGLYDDYYKLYVVLGQVGPNPVVGDDGAADGEGSGNHDDGDEANESAGGSRTRTSTDERQERTATVTDGVGRRTPSESSQATRHAMQVLPATGDVDMLLPLDLVLVGGLLVCLGLLRRGWE